MCQGELEWQKQLLSVVQGQAGWDWGQTGAVAGGPAHGGGWNGIIPELPPVQTILFFCTTASHIWLVKRSVLIKEKFPERRKKKKKRVQTGKAPISVPFEVSQLKLHCSRWFNSSFNSNSSTFLPQESWALSRRELCTSEACSACWDVGVPTAIKLWQNGASVSFTWPKSQHY